MADQPRAKVESTDDKDEQFRVHASEISPLKVVLASAINMADQPRAKVESTDDKDEQFRVHASEISPLKVALASAINAAVGFALLT
jgi:hypothetical protein